MVHLQLLLISQKSLSDGHVSSFPSPPKDYLIVSSLLLHCSAGKIFSWGLGLRGKVRSYMLPACRTVSTCSLFAQLSHRDLLLQRSLRALDAGLQPASLRGFQARLLLDGV